MVDRAQVGVVSRTAQAMPKTHALFWWMHVASRVG